MTAYLLVVFFVQFQKQEDQSVVDDLVSKLDSGWKKVQPFIQIAVVSEFMLTMCGSMLFMWIQIRRETVTHK